VAAPAPAAPAADRRANRGLSSPPPHLTTHHIWQTRPKTPEYGTDTRPPYGGSGAQRRPDPNKTPHRAYTMRSPDSGGASSSLEAQGLRVSWRARPGSMRRDRSRDTAARVRTAPTRPSSDFRRRG